MGLFDGSGMQMMLRNLLQAAAPDLAAQVDAVGATVQNFDQRLARVEQMTARILQILTHAAGAQSAQLTTEGNSHGDEHGIAGPDRNVGSDSHGIDKAS